MEDSSKDVALREYNTWLVKQLKYATDSATRARTVYERALQSLEYTHTSELAQLHAKYKLTCRLGTVGVLAWAIESVLLWV